jgi:hypothetical protein
MSIEIATQSDVRVWRTWNRVVLAVIGFACAIPICVNVLIDPYDLFRVSPIGIGPSLKQRVHHIRHLESNAGRFNVLLMGTSVMGLADPRVVDQEVPGARAYNMSFFVASPTDMLRASKYLATKGALPKRVVVGLDTFLFVRREAFLPKQFALPAEVSGESKIAWWTDAAYTTSITTAVGKLVESSREVPAIVYDLDRGNYSLPRSDAAIRLNPAAHVEGVLKPTAPVVPEDLLVESEFDALRQLREFFASRDVQVLWIIEPNSVVIRNAYGERNYQATMSRIRAQVSGDIVDLADTSGFQDDPAYWYDMKHPTAQAARTVLVTAIRQSTTFSAERLALK